MQRFLIIIETTVTGFSAYSPDVPGCVASGTTRADVEERMRDAIAFHLDGLRADGQPLPVGGTVATYVEIAA
ncbi:MAG: type II toxin-antitoxin system HicB family antitoxin [Gemmatimonadaceae bacterium]